MEKIQEIDALKNALAPQLEPKFSLNGVQAWMKENEAQLKALSEPEREAFADYFCTALSKHLKETAASFRQAMQPLQGKLDQAFREELSPDELLALQKEIYAACDPLVLESPRRPDRRGFYNFVKYVQETASLLGHMFFNWGDHEGHQALAQFLHDMGGLEGDAVRDMEIVHSLEGEADEETQAAQTHYSKSVRMAGMGVLRLLACTEILASRLGGRSELPKEDLNVQDLLEQVGYSQEYRFNEAKRGGKEMQLKFDVTAEPGTDTGLHASKEALYLIFMNIMKNAGKICAERNIPFDAQKITIELFERDDVLYVHYNDHLGGLDLTKIFESATRQALAQARNKTREQIAHPFQVILGGSFSAADQFTMRDLCELVFLSKVHARSGGSGLGLGEAKALMSQNGMYVSTSLNREDGTQFLLAFPKHDVPEKDLQDRVRQVEKELDARENKRLDIAA